MDVSRYFICSDSLTLIVCFFWQFGEFRAKRPLAASQPPLRRSTIRRRRVAVWLLDGLIPIYAAECALAH